MVLGAKLRYLSADDEIMYVPFRTIRFSGGSCGGSRGGWFYGRQRFDAPYELGDQRGMFFSFSFSGRWSFWMKDTYIPLDLIFIDKDYRITEIAEGKPLCEDDITPADECLYVVEVNRGWCAKNGVAPGQEVKIGETYYV